MALDISTQLSGANAPTLPVAVQPDQSVSQQPAPAVPTPAPAQDTVKLSTAAQAQALYQQGASASTIASSLGIDVATVDSYLDIVATTVPVAAVGGGGGGHATHEATASGKASEPVSVTPAGATSVS